MKWLLLRLLNMQKKMWMRKLAAARFEYDCVGSLSGEDITRLMELKRSLPEKIKLIDQLKTSI